MIVGGAIFIFCWSVLSLLLFLLPKMTILTVLIIFGSGTLLGILWGFYGIIRLHRTINPSLTTPQTLTADVLPQILPAQIDFLKPPPSRTSVTEGTTELLKVQNK
jgi:hypothetical protein